MSKRLICLMSLILLLGLGGEASAAYYYWYGTGDGSSWNDPANWDHGTVPHWWDRGYIRAGGKTVVIDGYAAVCDAGNCNAATVIIRNIGSFSARWY